MEALAARLYRLLKNSDSAFLCRRLKPTPKENKRLKRWPEGRHYPICLAQLGFPHPAKLCPFRKLFSLAWIAILGATTLVAQDVHAIADKVDQRYDHLHTLQAQFTETYSGAGMTRTESGTLLLKKPGRMRWDYEQPRPKLFITDGKIAWFYVPGERQARRTPVKQLDDLRSPLRYLLGKTKLEKELDGLSAAADQKPVNAGDMVLRGIPKGMHDRVAQTLLEVSADGLITRIVVQELDGSVTEFRFLQQKENVQVADQQFRFSPPPGVEIVAGTEMME